MLKKPRIGKFQILGKFNAYVNKGRGQKNTVSMFQNEILSVFLLRSMIHIYVGGTFNISKSFSNNSQNSLIILIFI